MARAIIAGLVADGYPAKFIRVCAPSTKNRDALMASLGIVSSGANIASVREAEVAVLAVKPQMMAEVCQPLREHVDFTGKLVLSIAAGIQVSRFYQLLSDKLSLMCIMPNTPSLVGKGMSGLYASPQVSPQDREYTADLMSTVGKVCWVNDENNINGMIAAINGMIAVAGSAPAYFSCLWKQCKIKPSVWGLTAKPRAIWCSRPSPVLPPWWKPTRIRHCPRCASR